MGQVLYGAQVFRSPQNEVDEHYDAVGKNSEVMTLNDILTVSSGVLSVAGATDVVYGINQKTQTMASDNQTVAKVTPPYIDTDDILFLMGSNGDFTGNATDAGTYYKLTGTTGAQQVDQASGVQTTTSRVVEIVQVDPFNIGGTGSGSGLRQVVVKFVKTPSIGVPTSS